MRNTFFVILVASLLLSGCTNQPSKLPLTPITVQLSWLHTAEFAGFYVAKEQGFYEAEGLDVTLLAADPTASSSAIIDKVMTGDTQFGLTAATDLMIAKSAERPVKAIFALFQRSPNAFTSLPKSGVLKPADLNNKTIGISCGSNSEYQEVAFLKKFNITYTRVCSEYSVDQLKDKKADVVGSFITNEVILWKQQGNEINTMLLGDYGVDNYPNLIFVDDSYLATHKPLVESFLRATRKGIEYSLQNETKALAATMKYDNTLNQDQQRETLRVQTPFIDNRNNPIGWMNETVLANVKQNLVQQGLLKSSFDPSRMYTLEFVDKQE